MNQPKQKRKSKECKRSNLTGRKQHCLNVENKTLVSENCIPSDKTNCQKPSKLHSSNITQTNVNKKNVNLVISPQTRARKKSLAAMQDKKISSKKKPRMRTFSWVDVCNRNGISTIDCDKSLKKSCRKPKSLPLKVHVQNIPVDDLMTPGCSNRGRAGTSNEKFCISQRNSGRKLQNNCELRKTSKQGVKRKVPTKGTIKHKRWVTDKLNLLNEGYEDDVYESEKFQIYQDFFQNDKSEISVDISTPKIGCVPTPMKRKKTPTYHDCYNLSDYKIDRKAAMEWHYTINKIKSKCASETSTQPNVKVPERKKLNFSEIISYITAAQSRRRNVSTDKGNSHLSEASNL